MVGCLLRMGLVVGLVGLLLLQSTNWRFSLEATLEMTSMAGVLRMNGFRRSVVVTCLVLLMSGLTAVSYGMKFLVSVLVVPGFSLLPLAPAGSAGHGDTWSCFPQIRILPRRGLGCIFQCLDLCRLCRGLSFGGSLLPFKRPDLFIRGSQC